MFSTIKNSSLLHKTSSISLFKYLERFSFREHLKHHKSEPKAYRRILPAAKNLILVHKIKEEDLPDLRIIKKEDILKLIKENEQNKTKADIIIDSSSPAKPIAPQQQQVNLFDEVAMNKEIDYIAIKNILPHSYYYQTAKIEDLLRHLAELNINHKKNIKLEDFIAKVVAKLINKQNNLKILFDLSGNKFINYTNKDIHIYLKNIVKSDKDFIEEQNVYFNPQTIALADVSNIKKNLSGSNEKFTPIVRYNC